MAAADVVEEAVVALADDRVDRAGGSGDLAIAFSTAERIPHAADPPLRAVATLNERHPLLDQLFAAAVEATEEAVVNALCAARPLDGRDGRRVVARSRRAGTQRASRERERAW